MFTATLPQASYLHPKTMNRCVLKKKGQNKSCCQAPENINMSSEQSTQKVIVLKQPLPVSGVPIKGTIVIRLPVAAAGRSKSTVKLTKTGHTGDNLGDYFALPTDSSCN